MIDTWKENPDFPLTDWQYEVANGDTLKGYRQWAEDNESIDSHNKLTELAPFTVSLYFDGEDNGAWIVCGDLRRFDEDSNHDVSELIESVVRPTRKEVDFDSEHSCFFAYTLSEGTAIWLVDVIRSVLNAEVHYTEDSKKFLD